MSTTLVIGVTALVAVAGVVAVSLLRNENRRLAYHARRIRVSGDALTQMVAESPNFDDEDGPMDHVELVMEFDDRRVLQIDVCRNCPPEDHDVDYGDDDDEGFFA